MSPFGVLAVICLLFAIAGVICFKLLVKVAKFMILGVALFYVLLFIFALLWAKSLYADGQVGFAIGTFAVGCLLIGTLLFAPIIWKVRVLSYIDMALFLLLGVTFIIMAVFLSKSVIQPSAPPFASSESIFLAF